jgi:ribosomal protein S18 acetylase RimI-like enzyme
MDELFAFARRSGVAWVSLRTFSENADALRFWRDLGFRPRIVQLVAATDRGPGERSASAPPPGRP